MSEQGASVTHEAQKNETLPFGLNHLVTPLAVVLAQAAMLPCILF